MKYKLKTILFIGLALIALFGMTACPNSAGGGGGGSTVNITVTGDEHINLPSEPVAVRVGGTWSEVQSTVKSKVSAKSNFLIDSWHLGADESAPELKDTDTFYTNAVVFVKSRPDLPDLSSIQGSGPQVKITFAVTLEEGGSILGPNSIRVNKGTPWNPKLKAYAAAALKVHYGFQCNGWKKNGNTVNNTFTFDDDTTIFAELEDLRINITVRGDSNVTVPDSTPLVVLNGRKWQDIKETAAGRIQVSDPSNIVVTAWHRGESASAPVLTDEYEFKKADGQNRTVFAKTGDRRITLTVTYGRVTGGTVTIGTVTTHHSRLWYSVQNEIKRNNPLLSNTEVEWHWNDKNGALISDTYMFDAGNVPSHTVYAFVRPKIITYYAGLRYIAPIGSNGSYEDYDMKKIDAVTNGYVGGYTSSSADNSLHTVSLTAYRIGITEVTQELYELVMANNPSYFQGSSHPPALHESQEKRPVEKVSWFDAIAFCNELTRCCYSLGEAQCVYTCDGHTYTVEDAQAHKVPVMDMNKKGFRLPTQAEWEWAAQSGNARQKWAGTDDVDKLSQYAWCNYEDDKTHHVGRKKENPFGLFDMSGNVWEWCWDWFNAATPAGGTDPVGPLSGTVRSMCGGSYATFFHGCRCAYRSCDEPAVVDINNGFRIVCRYEF